MEVSVDIISNRKKMENKEIKILLAAPRGFCAGVVRAIDIVEKVLSIFSFLLYLSGVLFRSKLLLVYNRLVFDINLQIQIEYLNFL